MNRWEAGTVVATTAAVFLAGVGLLIVITPDSPRPTSADVSGLKCRWSKSTGVASMSATITNSADTTRDYALRVDLTATDGVRVGSGDLVADDVRPGQVVEVRAFGSFTPGRDIDYCSISPR